MPLASPTLASVEVAWTTLDIPPPLAPTLAWLKREDGTQVIGWRVRDSLLGRSFFWCWSDEARRPTKYTSRWQKAGLAPVKPVAWRPYVPERITVPSDPIARREAEILVHRAILTDGTMRGLRRGGLESSWDDSLHHDDKERGAGELIDYEYVNKTRFIPSPRDVQNYEDGVILSWFLSLRNIGHWLERKGQSEGQYLMVWRAYGYGIRFASDKTKVTESNGRRLIKASVDAIWDQALCETRPVRRPRKEEWSTDAGGGP